MAGDGLSGRVTQAVATLNPGYFALVMGTGIISTAMDYKGYHVISVAMLVITAVAWVVLTILTAWRIARFWPRFRADFRDPRRGFGFFTFTAGTGVLGSRLVEVNWAIAAILFGVAFVSWLVLGYVVPWTAVLNPSIRPALPGANGTWFIWAVGSQSVAVLAASLQKGHDTGYHEFAVLAVVSWSVGVFLYAGIAILVLARLLLYPLTPVDLIPAYWVAMGATAITALAGSKIVEMSDTPTVDAVRGLIAGASVLFWAFGTWLIPVLIAAGIWRHWVHKLPLRYDATLWSIIFPLGMYGVGSHYLGIADNLPLLKTIGDVEAWVALAAWVIVFVAMVWHLWSTLLLGRVAKEDSSLSA